MFLAEKIAGFVLRQAIAPVAGDQAAQTVAEIAGGVIHAVTNHFEDHSLALSTALTKANDRAWQTVAISLSGNSFLERLASPFLSGDDKGIREQVRSFLNNASIGFGGIPDDFRKKCLVELNDARNLGLLSAHLSMNAVTNQLASFQRFGDPMAMIDGAERLMNTIGDAIALQYPNLAELLRRPPTAGGPLLVSAFAYFFRREVETDQELAHGLFFESLRNLAALQQDAFDSISDALSSNERQLTDILSQIVVIDSVVQATHTIALNVHYDVTMLHQYLKDRIEKLDRDHADRLHSIVKSVTSSTTAQNTTERYDEIICADPENASLYLNRAKAQLAAFAATTECRPELLDKAKADLDKAIQLDPCFIDAFIERAMKHMESEDYDSAVADLSRAIALNPSRADAYECRGDCHTWTEDWSAAISDYSASLRLSPADTLWIRRGDAAFHSGDYWQAISDYTLVLDLWRWARSQGRVFDEFELFSDILEAPVLVKRGKAHYHSGDHDAAISDLREYIDTNVGRTSPIEWGMSEAKELLQMAMTARRDKT